MVFSFCKLMALATLISAAQAFSGDGEFNSFAWFVLCRCRPGTYYDPDGNEGACGEKLQNSDYVVALASEQYSRGANCGRQIRVECTYNSQIIVIFFISQ